MPLSEQEQRLLDEMERSLYHGDGDFVAAMGRTRSGVNYSTVIGGVLLAIVGVGILVAGVVLNSWIVGVLGFVAMFVGVLLSVGGPRAGSRGAAVAGGPRFMDRLAARWERRRKH